jgi:hypothetical protein
MHFIDKAVNTDEHPGVSVAHRCWVATYRFYQNSRAKADWIYVFSRPINSNHRHRKGLVMDVSGPQRNVYPGTLTP